MSGGHFSYIQHSFNDISEEIENIIKDNDKKDEYDYSYSFNKKTLDEFKKAIKVITEARIYVQRIDWLVSDDDGEDTFHERLKKDLLELNAKEL